MTRLDYVVVVIDPTTASVEIAGDMLHMVKQIKAGAMPATAHLEDPELVDAANNYYRESAIREVLFVLNKIPDQASLKLLRARLSQKGIQPIAVIPDDSAIRSAWLQGGQIVIGKAEKELSKVIQALEG